MFEHPRRPAPAGAALAGALALAACAAALSHPANAGQTRIASTGSAKELLAGDALGTAVTADGRLTLGVPLGPARWPAEAAGAVVFGAASDPSGRLFVATGGGLGRVYLSRPDGEVSLLFEAPEPNVTAIAVGADGTVACGTSPGGKVYRVDPRATDPARAGTLLLDTGEQAVWALAFGKDGTLFAGTGNKGRIYRRTPDGKSGMLVETGDTHVRSLAAAPDGTLWAGTSDRGLVLSVSPSGALRTVYDFSRPEVSGLALTPDGALYAVGTSAEVPSLASAPKPEAAPSPVSPAPAQQPAAAKEPVPAGTVSVSTGPARLAPAPQAAGREGSAELVLVAPDGFVEPAWTLPDDTVFSIRWDASRGALLLATGPRGRLYSLKGRDLRLEAQVDAKQVVAAPDVPAGLALVTSGAPAVLRPAATNERGTASFTSAVTDAARLSAFGTLRAEATVPAGATLAFSVRAGNSDKPDGTWSGWSRIGPAGRAEPGLPAARFFQWRAEMAAAPKGGAPVVERVDLSYTERNARPVLVAVGVLEPGAVFPRGSASSGPAVLSVTSPDENGVFAGLEHPREGPEQPGKKLYRKGYRTVAWRATDPNGDSLRYDVEARREGSPVWIPIRRDVDDSWLSFDSSALPDGVYRFRVTASDRPSNPEGEALSASEETELAVVDCTPPVTKTEARMEKDGSLVLVVAATDALSPVVKAEGTVNADRWRPLQAEDGAADGPSERFAFRVPRPEGPAVVSVRVVDAAGNSTVASAAYPGDFR